MKSLILFSVLTTIISVPCFRVNMNPQGELLSKTGTDFAIFYNGATEEFYVLQFTSKPNIPTDAAFVSFSGSSLSLKDLSNNNVVNYNLNDKIYGIAKMSGSKYKEDLLTGSGSSISFVTDILEKISCKCYKDDGKKYKTCDAGGQGASECEVTDGGGVGIEWNKHCQVTCKENYYACCSRTK